MKSVLLILTLISAPAFASYDTVLGNYTARITSINGHNAQVRFRLSAQRISANLAILPGMTDVITTVTDRSFNALATDYARERHVRTNANVSACAVHQDVELSCTITLNQLRLKRADGGSADLQSGTVVEIKFWGSDRQSIRRSCLDNATGIRVTSENTFRTNTDQVIQCRDVVVRGMDALAHTSDLIARNADAETLCARSTESQLRRESRVVAESVNDRVCREYRPAHPENPNQDLY